MKYIKVRKLKIIINAKTIIKSISKFYFYLYVILANFSDKRIAIKKSISIKNSEIPKETNTIFFLIGLKIIKMK